jgi:hypothetical protein
MISDKARSISEMVYGLVEEYDGGFEVWEEILICLVGDHIVNVPAEEWDQRSARFKEDLDCYVGSFFKI